MLKRIKSIMEMTHLGHIWDVGRMDATSGQVKYENDPLHKHSLQVQEVDQP